MYGHGRGPSAHSERLLGRSCSSISRDIRSETSLETLHGPERRSCELALCACDANAAAHASAHRMTSGEVAALLRWSM